MRGLLNSVACRAWKIGRMHEEGVGRIVTAAAAADVHLL